MRRADRLFQIIQHLRTRRITTAAWLAEKLEVSKRTIYRDMDDLVASGVPIDGEAGVGYILREGFDLPPLMFSREEISALLLGASIVRSWADPKLADAAASALGKVKTVLPDALVETFENQQLFSPVVKARPQTAATMRMLRESIAQQKKVRFSYIRADGTASQRTVWPLGLFFWGAVWTLGSWCELREDFRMFRLDRIGDITPLQEAYPTEPGKTLRDFALCEQ